MIPAIHQNGIHLPRRLLLLLLCAATAMGSLDMRGTAFAQSERAAVATRRRAAHLLVVLVGGMDSDPTPAQQSGKAARNEGNSGLFQLCTDLKQERVIAEYFNWNGTRAGELKSTRPAPPRSRGIANFVRGHVQLHPADRVAIVGNSWGGHTALEVSRELLEHDTPIAVNYMVFLDASSAGRSAAAERMLPVNVNRAVHYFTRNTFVWGDWTTAGERIENIDLGNPSTGFLQRGGPAYNSPFSFRAHVAAEWDERIHADIRRRLLDLLPK